LFLAACCHAPGCLHTLSRFERHPDRPAVKLGLGACVAIASFSLADLRVGRAAADASIQAGFAARLAANCSAIGSQADGRRG